MKAVGFISAKDAMPYIEEHFDKRGELEGNESKLQVIPYVILTYGHNRVMVYKRAGTEQRLSGKLSVGFGGHSNKNDANILDTAAREIKEELSINIEPRNLVHAGYIFSNATAVSRNHIGYLFTYDLQFKEISKLQVSDEIEFSVLVDKGVLVNGELSKWSNLPLEDWSQIAVEHILK